VELLPAFMFLCAGSSVDKSFVSASIVINSVPELAVYRWLLVASAFLLQYGPSVELCGCMCVCRPRQCVVAASLDGNTLNRGFAELFAEGVVCQTSYRECSHMPNWPITGDNASRGASAQYVFHVTSIYCS